MGSNEDKRGRVWEVEGGARGLRGREQSGRWAGERKGGGMGLKRENSAMSSRVLKNMSCWAGLDNYCHLWGVQCKRTK